MGRGRTRWDSNHPILTSPHLASPHLVEQTSLPVGSTASPTNRTLLTNRNPSRIGSTAEIEQILPLLSGGQGLHVVTPIVHTLIAIRTHSRSGPQDLKTRPGRLSPETQTTCSFNHQEALRTLALGQGRIQMRSPRDWPASPSPVSFHSHLRPDLADSASWHAETTWARRLGPADGDDTLPTKQIALVPLTTARTQHTTRACSAVTRVNGPHIHVGCAPCRIKAGLFPPVGPGDECRPPPCVDAVLRKA